MSFSLLKRLLQFLEVRLDNAIWFAIIYVQRPKKFELLLCFIFCRIKGVEEKQEFEVISKLGSIVEKDMHLLDFFQSHFLFDDLCVKLPTNNIQLSF